MKILHVVPAFYPSSAYGGPSEAVYRLCRLLGEQGHDVRVLTTNANGRSDVIPVDLEHEVALADGLRVRYCARRSRNSVSPTLLKLLLSYVRWADVVHLSGVYSFPTIPTLLACRMLRKPVVWSPHGALQRWAQSRRVVGKKLFELACKAVMPRRVVCHVASAEEGDNCHRVGSVDVAILPHGVDIPPVPAPPGSGDGTLRMLYLGRLDPIKGIENLLTACRILRDTSALQWSLRIVGGGDVQYVRQLDEKVRSLGLAGRVAMTGAVTGEAKGHVFDAVDLVVVPSHRESFGLVVAEALAHGVPVVVSTGAPWQAIEGARCGLFVSNAPEALAGAIERIQTMALREMGLRGRNWMAREFSWPTVVTRMEGLYRGLETSGRMLSGIRSDRYRGADAGQLGKVCIVASCGGHLTEARALRPAFHDRPHFYVVNDRIALPDDMQGRTHFITHAERNWRVLTNFYEAWRILRRERPTIILSTGAGPIVPFALVGRLLRIPVIFVETSSQVTEPSVSGRIMYHLADRFFYQWRALAHHFPKGVYGGPVLWSS